MRIARKPVANAKDPGKSCHPQSEVAPFARSSHQELLDYIASMVLELKTMSARGDHRTLTGLLHLAYHEALQRRRVVE